MVLGRVIGHLEAGAKEKDNGILAKDVTRFCNQVNAQIKGVSESKEIQNRGYQKGELTEPVKQRITLVILRELIDLGLVENRHIATLFKEDAITSFEHLEIKNLAFKPTEVEESLVQERAAASMNQRHPAAAPMQQPMRRDPTNRANQMGANQAAADNDPASQSKSHSDGVWADDQALRQ